MARKQTKAAKPAAPPLPALAVGLGLGLSVLLGLLLGWLRYWLGLFTLAQGAVAGLLLAWLINRLARHWGRPAWHPGFRPALLTAALWFAAFMLGQGAGFGLAQPWFEPLGWLARLWDGKTVEPTFAIAATGPVHRAYAGGANGWFWLVLNCVDWLIMYVFLLAMPWDQRGKPRRKKAAPGPEAAP